jgi:hypothetical protein
VTLPGSRRSGSEVDCRQDAPAGVSWNLPGSCGVFLRVPLEMISQRPSCTLRLTCSDPITWLSRSSLTAELAVALLPYQCERPE